MSQYEASGWLWLKQVIPTSILNNVKRRALLLIKNNTPGEPSIYGSPIKWEGGIGCASSHDPHLMKYYTSPFALEIAENILGPNIWLYNDQIVYKINPHTHFPPHTDNSLGPNTDNAIHTVNCVWVLDNFTLLNGPICIENKPILAKAGDMICIRGDTIHSSKPNISGIPRIVYACVYSSEKLVYQNFYSHQPKKIS